MPLPLVSPSTPSTARNGDSASKRGTLVAMILASGVVFLDGTVVNVALPAIGRELAIGLSGLQWIVDGYALTLAALLIVGGSLGDHYGRKRMLVIGLVGFGIASIVCAAAPNVGTLIVARMLQGIAGALLVPEGLAIISAVFTDDAERGQAIGAWTGWGGIAAVIGPFIGGALVDSGSWRWVFVINVPLILVTLVLVARFVPETRDPEAPKRLDFPGAVLVILGLGGVSYALIEGPNAGWSAPLILATLIGGIVALVAFVAVEARSSAPMMPLGLFRTRNFTAANLATLGTYAALGGAAFFIVIYVQNILGYSAIAAGATLLPMSVLMLLFASRFGKLAGQYGPRRFMTLGPFLMGAGFLLFYLAHPGASYWTTIFPAAIVMGAGLCINVAPLTSTVMGSVSAHNSGIASAVNNVASRVAGLLAVAGIGAIVALTFMSAVNARAQSLSPDVARVVRDAGRGDAGTAPPGASAEVIHAIADSYTTAFHRAMLVCALLAFGSALVAFLMVEDHPAEMTQDLTAASAKEV